MLMAQGWLNKIRRHAFLEAHMRQAGTIFVVSIVFTAAAMGQIQTPKTG
jgi:hypothetical protein